MKFIRLQERVMNMAMNTFPDDSLALEVGKRQKME